MKRLKKKEIESKNEGTKAGKIRMENTEIFISCALASVCVCVGF